MPTPEQLDTRDNQEMADMDDEPAKSAADLLRSDAGLTDTAKSPEQTRRSSDTQSAVKADGSSSFGKVAQPLKAAVAHGYAQLPSLQIEALLPVAKAAFPRIDTDNNGFISEVEVSNAVKNPKFKKEEAVFVALLKNHLSTIQLTSNDEWGAENDGATRKDIAEFTNKMADGAAARSAAFTITTYGKSNFSSLDANKDGFLTLKEITSVEAKAGDDEKSLQLMKSNYADIVQASNDEWGQETKITKPDLLNYRGMVLHREVKSGVFGATGSVYKACSALREKTNSLYGNMDNPVSSIRPEAVIQGGIGDCYLLGPLASLAATTRGKETIRNMIRDMGVNDQGIRHLSVTFPGNPHRPIIVTAPTDSEMALYARGTGDGYWAPVVEKAYAHLINDAKPVFVSVAQDAIANGCSTKAGSDVFSADGAEELELKNTNDRQTAEVIETTLANGGFMTVFARRLTPPGSTANPADKKTDNLKLARGHSYSVVGYAPDTQKVTLRNPWGSGAPESRRQNVDDGIFEMSVAELKADFDWMEYGIPSRPTESRR